MIPRKKIDITLPIVAQGFAGCLSFRNRDLVSRDIETNWDPSRARFNLACLSVRSGFDALLSALDLPLGSEVLMSAVNIADMVRIVESHGLVPVAVDLDKENLQVDPQALIRSWSPRVRMIVVAHLFGMRSSLGEIVDFCNKNNVLLVEDCAQAYTGDSWRGEAASDVTFFSFGPVKTATALGGAVIGFRDQPLCESVKAVMAKWPVQRRSTYARRLLKYAFMIPFGMPSVFGAFVGLCRLLGLRYEAIVSGAVKGFTGMDFFRQLRQQPSLPLLLLLRNRIRLGVSTETLVRMERANLLRSLLAGRSGVRSTGHAHWLFPIMHEDKKVLIEHLALRGFDAAEKASSIGVIAAPYGREKAVKMTEVFESLVYVPAHEVMSEADVKRLAAAIAEVSC